MSTNITFVMQANTPDTFSVGTGLFANFRGSTAGKTIQVAAGGGAQNLSAGTAAIQLLGVNHDDTTVAREGSFLVIRNGADIIAKVSAGVGAETTITFADGSATLAVNAGALELGGVALVDGAAPTDGGTIPVVGPGPDPDPGQTFTLTTSIDVINGTTGNDTFIGGSQEIQAADFVDGGGGTDTFNMFLDTANGAPLTVTNVEKFFIQGSGAGGGRIFNALNVTGAEEMWSNQTTDGPLTINNIQNNLTLGLKDTDENLTATFVAGAIGNNGTLNLATQKSGTVAANATVTIDDGGATNTFTTLDVAALAGTYNVEIDTVGVAANATINFTTINTSGDGFVSLADADTGAVGTDPFANVTAVNLMATAGSWVNLGANDKNVTVTGGAGNDTIQFAAGEFNTSDVVDLGGGTNTLVLGEANLAQLATADLTKAINAAENVSVLATTSTAGTGITINNARYADIDSFAVGLGGAVVGNNGAPAGAADDGNDGIAAVTVSGLASSGTSVNIQNNLTGGDGSAGGAGGAAQDGGDGAAALVLRMGTDSGSDAVSLSVTGNNVTLTGGNLGAAAAGGAAGAHAVALDARQFETLNIDVSKDLTLATNAAQTTDVLVGANATINISGKGDVDLGTVGTLAGANFENFTVNAQDLNGELTVATGDGNDVIRVGSGDATVAAGDGTDQVYLGAGQDTVQFAAASNSGLETGAGTPITGIDKIHNFTAGLGGDELDWTGAAADFYNFTTAQRTTISNAGDLRAAADTAIGFVTTADTWAAFEFEGKTYAIFEQTVAATFDGADDLLIELVGVTATDLVEANFA